MVRASTSKKASATSEVSSASSSTSSIDVSASSSSSVATLNSARKPIVMKVNASDSDRLQLAQAINNLCVKGDAIIAAMNELSTFDKERIQSIDMQLESKKKEFADTTASLSSEYETTSKRLENDYADLKIKLSQQLREFKLEAAQNVLKEFNMVAIDASRYTAVENELQQLKETSQDALYKAVKDAETRAKHEHQTAVTNLALEHKAQIASLEAQVQQQIKEIKVLNDTIAGLKHELSAQRELTKEVAQASSKAQISQSFAK